MYEFSSVTLSGNELIFDDGAKRVATKEESDAFLYKRKPKAVKNSDGQWEIVRWADIHRHSGYSLLDGCISLEKMVEKTEFAGAVTDHGNMYASLKYYKAMKKANKLPIIGEEFYCETIDGEKNRNHLIVIAKNYEGYQNLIKLSSEAFENFYRKPQVSYEMLEKHRKGLIVTSACIGGEVAQKILQSKTDKEWNEGKRKVIDVILWFKKVFSDDYYLEIQRHKIEGEDYVNKRILQLAKEFDIKVIATTDSHYVDKDDAEVHDVLLCIGTKKTLDDEKRMKFEGTGYHLYSSDEIDELFSDVPFALDNTLEIMEKCKDFEIKTGDYYMPDFPLPEGYTDDFTYFKKISKDGFKERFYELFSPQEGDSEDIIREKNKQKKQYYTRFKYEMGVIEQMKFAGYFLIVWDFLKFCRDNGIATGPGRGSGAGSLVMYCLHITDIDPIKYDLLFERFLNPDRISMPDVDSDISQLDREKVIEYVTKRYGADHVSHIVTIGTLAAKQAVGDVARVMGVTPSDSLALRKLMPSEPKTTIAKALNESPDFKTAVENNAVYKKVIEIAQKLEGLPRNTGVHACFTKDALVETDTGFKKIVDVQVGDNVLTHMNRYKPVIKTMENHSIELLTIKVNGLQMFSCTPDHPLLIRKKVCSGSKKNVSYTNPSWEYALFADEEDLMGVPFESGVYKKLLSSTINTAEVIDGIKVLWLPIRLIKTETKCVPVYNLSVLDDNSYVVNGVIVHNCGICISKEPIVEYLPQARAINEVTGEHTTVTQYTMSECEERGVLKMDFLGLRTLDVIDYACREINRERDKKISLATIPIDDPKTYRFMVIGHTNGIFQFESPGMTGLVKDMFSDARVKDDASKGEEYFERLIAAVALYRPGPMDEIPKYVKTMKTGNVVYDTPKLESILNNTYGILVYQEQIMFAVRKLAGFTAGQSDTIRKAMSKKKLEIMDEYSEYFIYGSSKYDEVHPDKPKNIKGCIKNGISEEKAKQIWDKMVKFASYAFNKSHATCYAAIGAKTAWLSCYYPVEFLTGILNSYLGNADKLKGYISGCKDRKIPILPPDVNNSDAVFTVITEPCDDKRKKKNKSIRFGLSGVGGVGSIAAANIVEERQANGPFVSLFDFINRMCSNSKIDKGSIEALVKAGAFDCFGITRSSIISAMPQISKIMVKIRKENKAQLSFFDIAGKSQEKYSFDLPNLPEYDVMERARLEKEALGFFIIHPVNFYSNILSRWTARGSVRPVSDVLKVCEENPNDEIKGVRMAGLVTDVTYKTYYKKKGGTGRMINFNLDDGITKIRCTTFNASKFEFSIKENAVVYIIGTAKTNNFGINCLVDNAYAFKDDERNPEFV